jgi:hypothetical protein
MDVDVSAMKAADCMLVVGFQRYDQPQVSRKLVHAQRDRSLARWSSLSPPESMHGQ